MFITESDLRQPYGFLRSLDLQDTNRQGAHQVLQISGVVVNCEPHPQGVLMFDVAGVVGGLHSDIRGHEEALLHLPADEGAYSRTRIRFESLPSPEADTEHSLEVQFMNDDVLPVWSFVTRVALALADVVSEPMGIDSTRVVISSYRKTTLRIQETVPLQRGSDLTDI